MQKNKLKLTYKFITNFPPLSAKSYTSKIYLKFMQKIILNNLQWRITKQFCKNFFLFLCILQYKFRTTKVVGNFSAKPNITIFILPQQKTSITLLKAPFVNKLAKKHFCLHRYYFIVSIEFFLNENVLFNNSSQLSTFLITLLKSFLFFESNICYNYKINVSHQFKLI